MTGDAQTSTTFVFLDDKPIQFSLAAKSLVTFSTLHLGTMALTLVPGGYLASEQFKAPLEGGDKRWHLVLDRTN